MRLGKCYQLTRIYSEIPEIQHAHQVVYSLFEEADGLTVKIVDFVGNGCAIEQFHCPFLNFTAARRIVTYLYENSIGIGGCLDVVQDLGVNCTQPIQTFEHGTYSPFLKKGTLILERPIMKKVADSV